MGTHVITGAGSGIGAVVARTLLQRGENLLLVARNAERGEELRAHYPGAQVLVVDLGGDDMDSQLIAAGDFPDHIDSVVHAAGIVQLNPVVSMSAQEFQETLQVNLVAPAVLTRWALPGLRAARGSVIFVNSGAGITAHPNWGSYAASKAGLRALADSLRGEEGRNGVRVTSVFPGRTATPMQQAVRHQEGGDYDVESYLDPATVAAAIVQAIDLPRDATMPEIVLRPAGRQARG